MKRTLQGMIDSCLEDMTNIHTAIKKYKELLSVSDERYRTLKILLDKIEEQEVSTSGAKIVTLRDKKRKGD